MILFLSTIVYPRCTNPSLADPDTDCGSAGWAYSLFIAWNLLSMVSIRIYMCVRVFFHFALSSTYSPTCLPVIHLIS